MKPTLVLLAGPNGAGKSTLYEYRVKPAFAGPFINADLIQRDELKDPSMAAAYSAARIAEERRRDLIKAGRSFATETVFSHPSKLDVIADARRNDYMVIVMHVGVDLADLSVARVAERTKEGGHDVPQEKIRARFERSAPLIRAAVLSADRGLVFDNSKLNTPPKLMLAFNNGRIAQSEPVVPRWVQLTYSDALKA